MNFPDLETEAWRNVLARLLRQAAFRVSTGRWSGRIPDQRWVAEKSEEFVNTALQKIIDGGRRWNRDRYPDFYDFAKAAVDSEISNAKRRLSNRVAMLPIDGPKPVQVERWEGGGGTPSPEQEAVDADLQRAMLDAVADDSQVRDLVEVVLVLGIVKRGELMEYFEMDGRSYDTLRRRAQRRLSAAGFDLSVLLGFQTWEGGR